MTDKCAQCLFWKPRGGGRMLRSEILDQKCGECRHHSPIGATFHDFPDDGDGLRGRVYFPHFPPMSASGWCGDFKQAEDPLLVWI
jgi:hypothetical protein